MLSRAAFRSVSVSLNVNSHQKMNHVNESVDVLSAASALPFNTSALLKVEIVDFLPQSFLFLL